MGSVRLTHRNDNSDSDHSDVLIEVQQRPKIKNKLTVEPLLFMFIAVDCFTDTSIQNMYLDKACHSLQFNRTVCGNLNNFEEANVKVEELTSYYMVYGHFIRKFPGVILAFFVGNFSDENGRKFVILLPLLGVIITNTLLYVNTFFQDWSILGILLAEIPHGVFGGWFIMLGGCMSYVADITDEKQRSQRIGIAEIALNGGCPFGYAASYFFYRFLKERGILAIGTILQLLVFLDLYYRLPETRMRSKNKSELGILTFLKELFSCKNVSEAGKVLTKERDKSQRQLIILILLTHFLLAYANSGYYCIEYLYLKRILGWSLIEYSSFQAYSTGTTFIGIMLAVYLFIKKLKLNDLIIGLMAFSSRLGKFMLITIMKNANTAYLASGLTPMTETCFTIIRAITSKAVTQDEQGKIFLVASLADSITSLLSKMVSLAIFEKTVANYPSLCLNVLSVALSMCIAIFIWLYWKRDKFKIYK